jgi:iron complex transport system substrate-binding protein
VGRSPECDFPEEVRDLPVLTEAKLDVRKPGGVIDQDVHSLVRDGLSLYRVDTGRLRALAPDLILTQTHCEVCAASPRDLDEALAAWLGAKPALLSLAPATLGDVWADLLHTADALGVIGEGHRLAAALANRVTDVAERTMRQKARPRVACIEWIDPLMAAGNWMPELLTLAGASSVFGATGQHSSWITFDALRAADPDVIVILPCGFDLRRTRQEMGPLLATPGFATLRAVAGGRCFLADGNAYFNRPGPRLVESLEILAQLAHPDLFPGDFEGRGWERL